MPSGVTQATLDEALADEGAKIFVESIGGCGVAYEMTRRALSAGRHVVTSNKELGVLWNKKIKECGLFFDKVLKKYTPAPEEAKEAE